MVEVPVGDSDPPFGREVLNPEPVWLVVGTTTTGESADVEAETLLRAFDAVRAVEPTLLWLAEAVMLGEVPTSNIVTVSIKRITTESSVP